MTSLLAASSTHCGRPAGHCVALCCACCPEVGLRDKLPYPEAADCVAANSWRAEIHPGPALHCELIGASHGRIGISAQTSQGRAGADQSPSESINAKPVYTSRGRAEFRVGLQAQNRAARVFVLGAFVRDHCSDLMPAARITSPSARSQPRCASQSRRG